MILRIPLRFYDIRRLIAASGVCQCAGLLTR